MADLLTVYDDGEANLFIDCKVCGKRIRGDTNYKIHMTTLQHYKKEKALADKGFVSQPDPLPQWANIKEYLMYLNLNEPIIGLGDLVQEQHVISNDGSTILRYRCRLCAVQMDLCEMVAHVVGRRHRQKYLERHRSDLVTWGKNSEKQAGVVARAKAAIVEKQEGWGNPVPLVRSEKEPLVRNQAQARPPNVRGKAPSCRDKSRQSSYNPSYTEADEYRKPSHYHDDNQYDQSYRYDLSDSPSASRDNRYDNSYSDDGRETRTYQDRDYVERSWEGKMNTRAFSSERTPERQTFMDNEGSQTYDDNGWYPEENSSQGAYKSRHDDSYYHGDTSENRFGGSEGDYRESRGMRDSMYMSHGTGPSMDERQQKSRNLPYTQREREHYQDLPGAERHGSFEMQDYDYRQRYYETEDDLPSKKKRKSRFSDATPLEIALSKNSDIDAVVLKHKRRAGPVMQTQTSGSNMDSDVTPRMDNVLDVLNGIEIENVEEANFLKEKLCTLLKEFQSSKAQRTQQKAQALQSSSDFIDRYRSTSSMEPHRDTPQSRRMDDHGFQEPSRYSRDLQGPREYVHTRHVEENPESMRQKRVLEEPDYQWNPYREGSAGRAEEPISNHSDDRRVYHEATWNSRPLREEERGYTDQHRYQHDYRPGGDVYNPFEPSSSPPLETSNPSLDKLASTLLELVARKAK